MILLYSILYLIALVFVFPFEYFKRPKDLRKQWLSEKMGNVHTHNSDTGTTIWIHAVSVGETLAAIPFIRKLMESGYTSIVLSTITDTGRQIATEKSPQGVKIVYLPFDLKIFLKKALRHLSPDIFITMETELWPNLLCAMRDAHVPILILNGRISDRSFYRYRKIRFFLKGLFSAVVAAGMQTKRDADRMKEMGMDRGKVHITGNFKFDIHGTLEPPDWVRLLKGTHIVAGSTHDGEEELIVEAYRRLKTGHDFINLILAPRHPRRFNSVERLLQERSVQYLKRSEIDRAVNGITNSIILVDVLGELGGIYSIADICIIGGSFIPVGGHNLFEAAYWSKPIVCGPHMNNFPLTEEFINANAVRIVNNSGLYDILSDMLNSVGLRKTMGENAFRLFKENSGAVNKALEILEPYLQRSGP